MDGQEVFSQMGFGLEAKTAMLAHKGALLFMHHAGMSLKSITKAENRVALLTLEGLYLVMHTSNLHKRIHEGGFVRYDVMMNSHT